jgi:dTDP-4-amino-4,6-dideoxygalactose transaminase
VDQKVRDKFVQELNGRGVGASIHFYPPVHHMLPYKGSEFVKDKLPVTEKVIREIVTLPMYPQMVDEDIQYVVEAVADILSELR